MRPALLDPLFTPATALDGVGAKVARLIAQVVSADTSAREVRIADLLFVLPHSVIDRRRRWAIATTKPTKPTKTTTPSTTTPTHRYRTRQRKTE
jgi:hypothetical protein